MPATQREIGHNESITQILLDGPIAQWRPKRKDTIRKELIIM